VRVARLVLALCAALGIHAGAAQPSSGVAPPEGLLTYIGWRVFQAQCATCHAADARGSSFAPDLALRMSAMTQRDFFVALDRGYLGSQSTMPPRGRDPNVAPYYDELWSFLRARISGDLPPGPVTRLPHDEGAVAD
jgi:mono/diheme cytochrome c family protein